MANYILEKQFKQIILGDLQATKVEPINKKSSIFTEPLTNMGGIRF